MLGSEVGAKLGFYKGALYKRFPSLWRKVLTLEERKTMSSLNVGVRTLCNMGTMVVKATEAIKVLTGRGEYFRRTDTDVAATNSKNKEAVNKAFCRSAGTKKEHEKCKIRENLTYVPWAQVGKGVTSTQTRRQDFITSNVENPASVVMNIPVPNNLITCK